MRPIRAVSLFLIFCFFGYNIALQQLQPTLTRDLPVNFAEGEKEFDRRIKARFKTGSSIADLKQELRKEGFHVSQDHETALYAQSQLVCQLEWRIIWDKSADGKTLAAIRGVYNSICL